MVLDCHIHMAEEADSPKEFERNLKRAGVGGGVVLSEYPASFEHREPEPGEAAAKLARVMEFTRGRRNLYPFFFIDPLEEDAPGQVDRAVQAGVAGFKAICNRFYPQDDRAMRIWERIARAGKSLLFHSGILYNDGPSAEFNRPGNFEHLFYIDGLRFALAHISWPWCDELIAVFGKWEYFTGRPGSRVKAELYVDLTPGTPPIYRREALEKLLTVGYPILPKRMIFGTDATTRYDSESVAVAVGRDQEIYRALGAAGGTVDDIFGGNLLRFLGVGGSLPL